MQIGLELSHDLCPGKAGKLFQFTRGQGWDGQLSLRIEFYARWSRFGHAAGEVAQVPAKTKRSWRTVCFGLMRFLWTCARTLAVALHLLTSLPRPKRRFTAMQRYVRSRSTSRHGADIVNVRQQPSSRLAYRPAAWPTLAAMRRAGNRTPVRVHDDNRPDAPAQTTRRDLPQRRGAAPRPITTIQKTEQRSAWPVGPLARLSDLR